MTGEIEILQPGLFSTVQDPGRFGFMKFGVPISGPMDTYAAKIGNLLLQNPENSAVLEITLTGPKLLFSKPAVIVITGANLSAAVNGNALENNEVKQIHSGDILSFGKRVDGCRSYLAIKGGVFSEDILGSQSWYEGLTTYSRLEKGCKLGYKNVEIDNSSRWSNVKTDSDYMNSNRINVLPGPEYNLLPLNLQKRINSWEFKVDNKNNRMAIQLKELFENSLEPIITGPVVPGTIQLTPSGKLIVLMKDCQTTGGYPRILNLTEAGMNVISQKIEGDKITFEIK